MVWAYTCSDSTEEIEFYNFRTRNDLQQHIDADHKKSAEINHKYLLMKSLVSLGCDDVGKLVGGVL